MHRKSLLNPLKRPKVWLKDWQDLPLEKLGLSRLQHSTSRANSNYFLSLAKDQTEINRIISEVSKGSKFYEVR